MQAARAGLEVRLNAKQHSICPFYTVLYLLFCSVDAVFAGLEGGAAGSGGGLDLEAAEWYYLDTHGTEQVGQKRL